MVNGACAQHKVQGNLSLLRGLSWKGSNAARKRKHFFHKTEFMVKATGAVRVLEHIKHRTEHQLAVLQSAFVQLTAPIASFLP